MQNGLSDPPDGIGNETHAAFGIEFARRMQQAEVAFIDQIGQGKTAPFIFTGHLHHKAQITLHQLMQRLLIASLNATPQEDLFCRCRHRLAAHFRQVRGQRILGYLPPWVPWSHDTPLLSSLSGPWSYGKAARSRSISPSVL